MCWALFLAAILVSVDAWAQPNDTWSLWSNGKAADEVTQHLGGVVVLCPSAKREVIENNRYQCSYSLIQQWECACAKDVKVSAGHYVSYVCSEHPKAPRKYSLFSVLCAEPFENNTKHKEALQAGWEGNWTLSDGPHLLDAPRRLLPLTFLTCFGLSILAMLASGILLAITLSKRLPLDERKSKIHIASLIYFFVTLLYSISGASYALNLQHRSWNGLARFSSGFQISILGIFLLLHQAVVPILLYRIRSMTHVPLVGLAILPVAGLYVIYPVEESRDFVAVIYFAVCSVANVVGGYFFRKPDEEGKFPLPSFAPSFTFAGRWRVAIRALDCILAILFWLTFIPLFHFLPLMKPDWFFPTQTWAFRNPAWTHEIFGVVYIFIPIIYYIVHVTAPLEVQGLYENEGLNQNEPEEENEKYDDLSSGSSSVESSL